MKTQQATEEKWRSIVERARASGASQGLVGMLEGGEITYTEGDITWSAPRALRAAPASMTSSPVVQRATGIAPSAAPAATSRKLWHELTPMEKHRLAHADPKAYRALRDELETHNGKAWDRLTDDDQTTLYRTDNAKWIRMRSRAIADARPKPMRFADDEDDGPAAA